MTKQWKIGIAMIGASLLLVIIALFVARGGIKRGINMVRADRLQGQAETAFAEEDWATATRKATAAHYLDPTDEDIQLLVARSLLKQRNLSTVGWWQRVLDQPDLPLEELRELTTILLQSRRFDEALPFLERLVELDGNNPETQNLWLMALSSRRNLTQSFSLAGEMVARGSENWGVHQQFMQLSRSALGGQAGEREIDHLKGLITEDGALALAAARELGLRDSASREERLLAANYLLEKSEEPVDRLFAIGLQVKADEKKASILKEPLESFLKSNKEDRFERALEWALWMEAPEMVLNRMAWEDYRDSGASVALYFQALLKTGTPGELVDLTERDYSETDPESMTYLVYRAAGQDALKKTEEATATLAHAVQVVDPGQTLLLERYLLSQNRWELLVQLYESMLDQNPDNPVLVRYLGALYYTGQQEKLSTVVNRIEFDDFEDQPGTLAFALYLKLIIGGFQPELHKQIESYLSRYPEVYDFRLLAGLSYLLRGEQRIAQSFTEGMPSLDPDAPRHIRVSAALLLQKRGDLFRTAEMEYFLPRERYFLSSIPE